MREILVVSHGVVRIERGTTYLLRSALCRQEKVAMILLAGESAAR